MEVSPQVSGRSSVGVVVGLDEVEVVVVVVGVVVGVEL